MIAIDSLYRLSCEEGIKCKLVSMLKAPTGKAKKHVPVIDIPDAIKPGEAFNVEITVGKEISHPNTIEHHIKWFDLYAIYDDGQFLIHLGHIEFTPVTHSLRQFSM